MPETTPPAVAGENTAPETVEEPVESTDAPPPAPAPRDEPPAQLADPPAEEESSPAPTPSPTTPDTTEEEELTRAQATARCLQSGISNLDVLALASCVRELLG